MQSYENEAELQHLIGDSPEIVGASSTVVALREFSLPEAGYLDALLVELDGSLTLVEAKLNRNAEIRRAVVGQLLGYAGGLWGLSYDQLDSVVRDRTGQSLPDLARGVAQDDDFDEEGFRVAVADNLRRGAFRLVFAVDGVTEDLRRAVEYLNAHTVDELEVVVLELAYSKIGDVEILVPHTFGEEAVRRKHAARTSKTWTQSDFFEMLGERASDDEAALVQQLYDWAEPRVSHFYWGEGQTPSCTFIFEAPEGPIQPCGVYFTGSGLRIAVNFDWMKRRPHAALEDMLAQLQVLPPIEAMSDEIVAKRPMLPAAEYADGGIDALIKALDDLLAHRPEPSSA